MKEGKEESARGEGGSVIGIQSRHTRRGRPKRKGASEREGGKVLEKEAADVYRRLGKTLDRGFRRAIAKKKGKKKTTTVFRGGVSHFCEKPPDRERRELRGPSLQRGRKLANPYDLKSRREKRGRKASSAPWNDRRGRA